MKILLIFNDDKLAVTEKYVNEILQFIDKTYKNNAFVKYDIAEADCIYDLTEMLDAYNDNDFDFFIVSFKKGYNFNEQFGDMPKLIGETGINMNDIMLVLGTDAIIKFMPDIKNFIKEKK